MTVVEGWFCGKAWSSLPTRDALSADMLELLNSNCSMNSKAFLVEKPDSPVIDFVGNRTECALLVLLKKLGIDYNATREQRAPDQIRVRSIRVCAGGGGSERCETGYCGHACWSREGGARSARVQPISVHDRVTMVGL